jgi:hypothetical protein
MGLSDKMRFKKVDEIVVFGNEVPTITLDKYGEAMVAAEADEDPVASVQKKMDTIGASDEYTIIIPKENEIQIDYDYPELPLIFPELLGLLARAMQGSLKYKIYCSMSGNRHVVIECPRTLTDIERIAWQAVFASDPKREALSMMNLSRGLSNPSLLIHRKDGTDLLSTATYVLEQPSGRKFR